MEKFVVNVKCPSCRKSLMDAETQIDGYPSVKTKIQHHENTGILYLSSVFGSYNILSGYIYLKRRSFCFFVPNVTPL